MRAAMPFGARGIGLAIGVIGTVCLAVSAMAAPTVTLDPFSNVDNVVDITHAGDSRLFVVDRDGEIRVVQSDGSVESTAFLDITERVKGGGERGLLGLAFHPDYATNGYFYVNYTWDPDESMDGEDGEGDTRISRFSRTGDYSSNIADPDSELVVLPIAQPFSNHNAGDLNFGPDGYLWIAMGDGGSGGDPQDNGQDPGALLGKMLRIDVDSASPYAIPLDNPFVGAGDPLDEIWAFGFRNPFRFSFDSSTGDIWIGDVGQGDWEEVDVEPAGSSGGLNYGWRCYEGDDPFNLTDCGPEEDYTFPVHSYDHSGARCSVIGGFVYRGSDFSSLIDGYYFFSDFCSGDLYSLRPGSCPGTYDLGDHGSPLSNPTTFGEGFDGEIYVGESDGDIFRIEATGTPSDPAPCVECPASPSTICRQPGATKASLYIKNDVDEDAKDRLTWKWLNGEPTPKSAFGDPDPANYALCLYGSPEPIQIDIPGVATCPSCWTETASGFKYKAASGAIRNVLLKGSDVPGKSRVVVKGKDTGLPDDLPTIPVEQPITVQLHNSDDECWDATYSAPATKNENQIFRDKSDE